MPVIQSQIDTNSDEFRANREAMLAAVDEFRALEAKVLARSERARDKFHQRGQLLPRERIGMLLDRGRPYIELSTLAGLGMHDDDGAEDVTGGGNIVGIGFVSGVRCLVTASNSAIKGGSITPMGLKKSLRAHEVARDNKLPLVNLIESAGANLLYQAEIFVDGGQIFCNMARLSAAGIPVITVVHGSSTAGGAYMPGLSDYVVVVRGRSKIFLAGPPLLKAATGEIADDESLGGAEMHATVAGTAEYLAEDDAEAISTCREIVAKLGWNEALPVQAKPGFKEPRYDPDEIAGVVPVDYRKPYDVRELIARLVDDSDFFDFKPRYGPNTVCGHAAIEGHPCALIGNNGPIFPDDSVKAAQFIQLCCQSGTPIIYLQNTTGYMVGTESEAKGMVKHGSKMIQAVANASVPQLTLMVGGSFGAGNYGMCGRSYDPRFLFAWPNSRVSVMGSGQLAKVMSIITEEKFKREGKEVDHDALGQMEKSITERIDREALALYATARLWDDGLIDPRDSRKVLAEGLAICREAGARELRPNSFGVARG
jgi:geranyl-CoA carboxylase beta subunit